MNCNLCPRMCNTNRSAKLGFCKKPNRLQISKAILHYGEEPYLTATPNSPSGAIFFAGCNLKCVYCQNYDISNGSGKTTSIKKLANLFDQLLRAGATNIDLVTPTHYSNLIYKALKLNPPKVPVIYNCGGYENLDTIKKLAEVVDIFLFDLKYYDDNLSTKYSAAPNYFKVATNAITLASKLKPNKFKGDQLVSGVVIRHLCLPSHTGDSIRVLDWIKSALGENALVSLMSQYLPMGNAKNYPEINRTLKPLEYKIVVNHALKLGFTNLLTQDLSSNTSELIPDFNTSDNFIY